MFISLTFTHRQNANGAIRTKISVNGLAASPHIPIAEFDCGVASTQIIRNTP
jgi:hypothetical protein